MVLIEHMLYAGRDYVELENTDQGLAVALAQHGFIATAPEYPRSAMSIPLLDLYRVLSTRCPNLGIQAFTRTVCDMQLVCSLI